MNMRFWRIMAVLSVPPLLASCVLMPKPLELGMVGPGPNAPSVPPPTGALKVYTAVKCYPYDHQFFYAHTDYGVYAMDDHRVKSVRNAASFLDLNPAIVALPAGTYHVVAWAKGYDLVRVPVVIEAGRLTTVNLEDGVPKPAPSGKAGDLVRMPDGRIVGWSASASGGR